MIPSDNHTRDFMSHPLIKTICRNQATSPLETFLKRRFLNESFATRIDLRHRFSLCPIRDQAPPHRGGHASRTAGSHNRNRLCRSDVVAGMEFLRKLRIKFLGKPVSTRQSITSAHSR